LASQESGAVCTVARLWPVLVYADCRVLSAGTAIALPWFILHAWGCVRYMHMGIVQ